MTYFFTYFRPGSKSLLECDSPVYHLRFCRKKSEKLNEDLETERFQRLAEQDRVIQSEQKRYMLERSAEKLHAQNLKLSVKLEELQMKYEPG